MHLQGVVRLRARGVTLGGRTVRLLLALLALLAFFPLAGTAIAETVHVSASADPGLPQTQARQQALERALAEAVVQDALRLLPGPVPETRSAALRQYLVPRALDFVQSYQEMAGAKPSAEQQQHEQDAPQPLALEFDVTVQRAALRQALVRLGFFAGAHHPGVFVLHFGPGVTQKDAQALDAVNSLLGLVPAAQAPVAVTLERLPQGYYKAVLRQSTNSVAPGVLAADAADLPGVWLEIWSKFFSDHNQQAGAGLQELVVVGFGGVDAVLDFLQLLSTWGEAVQEPKLELIELEARTNARFTFRVISQERLDARLREALASRKLTVVSPAGNAKP